MNTTCSHKTAILLFARTADEEIRHKPIPKGNMLFDGLTKHTLCIIEKTGLPYYHFSEEEQFGISFGERFVNAIAAVFSKGYDAVITLGNDCPRLTSGQLAHAARTINDGTTVLGPSTDGGFYLMGIYKSMFDAHTFAKLPWQTHELLEHITETLLSRGGTIQTMRRLADVDTHANVLELSKQIFGLSKTVATLVLSLFIKPKAVIVFFTPFWHLVYPTASYNKGSPTLSFYPA